MSIAFNRNATVAFPTVSNNRAIMKPKLNNTENIFQAVIKILSFQKDKMKQNRNVLTGNLPYHQKGIW
jgi:hypothetical protein